MKNENLYDYTVIYRLRPPHKVSLVTSLNWFYCITYGSISIFSIIFRSPLSTVKWTSPQAPVLVSPLPDWPLLNISVTKKVKTYCFSLTTFSVSLKPVPRCLLFWVVSHLLSDISPLWPLTWVACRYRKKSHLFFPIYLQLIDCGCLAYFVPNKVVFKTKIDSFLTFISKCEPWNI